MGSANERRLYNITSSLSGWAHTQNGPCIWGEMLKITCCNPIQIQYYMSRALFTKLIIGFKTVPSENNYARIHPVELTQCLWLRSITGFSPNYISPALLVRLNFRPILTAIVTRVLVRPLQWRHNGRDGVLNHQPHDCLLNRLFRHRPKKTPKLHATCLLCVEFTGEFPA